MVLRSPLLIVLLVAAALPAGAAPVDGDAVVADPYELAMRWTLAGLSPQSLDAPQLAAAPAPAVRFSALPHGNAGAGVPDPGAYALMGLGLLGAGLVVRRLRAGQRGFSKKT